MSDQIPGDAYHTVPVSSYTEAKLRLLDANGRGVEVSLNLNGPDTGVTLETSPQARVTNPVTGEEEITSINLRLTVTDAPQPWSVERVGEW